MPLGRRAFLRLSAGAALTPASTAIAARPLRITDMLDRKVELAKPPQRLALLEGRDILTMAMLHPEPSKLVVGWAAPERIDSDAIVRAYESEGPGGAIPLVGRQTPDTISLEGIISFAPDLVVANAFMEPGGASGELVQRLEQIGIPVLFSDSSSNSANRAFATVDEDLARAMRMWGAILDRGEKAEEFIAFHQTGMERVRRALASAAPRKTYLEIMSVLDDCCWAAGSAIWGELLAAAGGRSLNAVSTPWFMKIQLEHLLEEEPDVYIGTGGGYVSGSRPALGPGLDAQAARNALRRLTKRTGFDTLPAVRNGEVHCIWTGLITVPQLNLVFVEIAAKWLHPELCRDMDPQATLDEINRRFLAQPMKARCG